MGQIKVEKNVGGIEGLCVIEPAVHGDARGYFMETYNEKDMKEAGIDIHFVQDMRLVLPCMFMLFQTHSNTPFIMFRLLTVPVGFVHAAMRFNFENCYNNNA